ncbi:MAG: heavy metal translocating P-type ATPase, partial [Gammaproteobacteria bacterium]
MRLTAGSYLAADEMSTEIEQLLRWCSLLVTSVVVGYAGQPFLRNALAALRHRNLNMDVPVALAVTAAFLASALHTIAGQGETWFESVSMFIFFLLGGRYLELRARMRSGRHVDNLARAIPQMAHRLQGNSSQMIRADELIPDDRCLVKSGESLPADGLLCGESATLDEAMLTGESRPVERMHEQLLYAGTLNVGNPLEIQVTQAGENTRLSTIRRLSERAETSRPVQTALADRVAAWFVGALLLATLIIAGYWLQVDPDRAFEIALATLVVTCPCALSLATPAALTAATGKLGEMGLLVTSPRALEQLSRIRQLLFDKTGTLTQGHPSIEAVQPLAELDSAACLAICAALERGSSHPIARAFAGADDPALTVTRLTTVAGRGISGDLGGKEYRLGNLDYATEPAAEPATELGEVNPETATEGSEATTLWLAEGGRLLGRIELQDSPRVDAADAIAALHTMGIRTGLISGDNRGVANSIARRLGIDYAKGRLSPEQKLAELRRLQRQQPVGMVGDGINDAAVLAGASVAIAMGQGTDISKTRADAVLLNNQLAVIPRAIRLAGDCQRIIRQNLVWALAYNLVALPLAASGIIQPWMAALGMSASSLIVVINALRLQARSTA